MDQISTQLPESNPLMPPNPQSAPGTGLALRPQATPGLLQGISQQHDFIRSLHDKVAQMMQRATLVASGLATLAKLGPMIEPDDVVSEAGKLVSSGIEPKAMATILAEMPPQGGEALQQWIAGHAANMAQTVAQLAPQLAQARHELGTSALRLLAAQHLSAPPTASAPGGPDNAG